MADQTALIWLNAVQLVTDTLTVIALAYIGAKWKNGQP
jgi:hypothetical protein